MEEITYKQALKKSIISTSTSWRELPWLVSDFWYAFKIAFWAFVDVILHIVGPLLVPLCPLAAWLYIRSKKK